MKYKAKIKDCYLIVTAKASFKEYFDTVALDAFSRMYLRGFLKPKTIKKKSIEYSGPVGISLYDKLKKPFTKRDFYFVMEQIVTAIQKVQFNNLSLDKLVLDVKCCFINDTTKEMQFLYVPTVDDGSKIDIMAFLNSIFYSMKLAPEDDTEYVSRFVYFLQSQQVFDPAMIEGYIATEDPGVVRTIRQQNAGRSGFMTSRHKSYYEHYQSGNPSHQPVQQVTEATVVLSEETESTALLTDENATELLCEEAEGTALLDESAQVHMPALYRVSTGETIFINKNVFRLGQESRTSDYCVNNNDAISRNHADIVTRGAKCFVVDLNSRNHTFINNRMLPARYETEIRDGESLKLGNEEFIFKA